MMRSRWSKALFKYFQGLLKWEEGLYLVAPWGKQLVRKAFSWHKLEATAREFYLSSPSHPCPEFQSLFQEERVCQILKDEIIFRQLKEIDGAFRGGGIEFLVLKGPFWAEQVYPSALWRHLGDIDLLVRPEACRTAANILLQLGYQVEPKRCSFEEQLTRRGGMTFLYPGGGCGWRTSVSLHWQPLHSPRFMRWLQIETEDLFVPLELTPFRGLQLLLPGPEVRFGYLVIHGVCHHQLKRLLPLMDLAHLLGKCPPFDYEFLVELMRKWKAMISLYIALKALWLFGFREDKVVELWERLEGLMPWRVRLLVNALSPTQMLLSYSGKGYYMRKLMRLVASNPSDLRI